jgi:PPK2 family polyphosphate:nucleotide phosphotransferase
MKLDPDAFLAKPEKKLNLKKWPTSVHPFYKSKEDYHRLLDEHIHDLKKLQNLLYAHNRYALLIIFQAMDAGGKDSAIEHVMSGVNPQGCQVYSFKQPSSEELDHDFLWRAARALPERGRIGIFNRSYYEEVLVVRVHPELLRAESLPEELVNDKCIWEERFESIRDFEKYLFRNGTRTVKFFLHLSKEEQRKRFLKRIDDPEKNWKFSAADLEEREKWADYMHAYEQAISATSANEAPWYVVPADDKRNARLIISKTILEVLGELKMSFPKLSSGHTRELKSLRSRLAGESR